MFFQEKQFTEQQWSKTVFCKSKIMWYRTKKRWWFQEKSKYSNFSGFFLNRFKSWIAFIIRGGRIPFGYEIGLVTKMCFLTSACSDVPKCFIFLKFHFFKNLFGTRPPLQNFHLRIALLARILPYGGGETPKWGIISPPYPRGMGGKSSCFSPPYPRGVGGK